MSGWQVAALIVAAWFSLCACLLCGWMAWVTLADIGRRRRRGGYIQLRPSASSVASRVGRYTTDRTGALVENGSSNQPPGQVWEATAIPPTPPKPSRTTAPTSSGSDPAGTNRGANTTDAPEPYVVERNYFKSGHFTSIREWLSDGTYRDRHVVP